MTDKTDANGKSLEIIFRVPAAADMGSWNEGDIVMAYRFLLILAFFLVAANPTRACRYEPMPLADQVKAAKAIFVGTVSTVENGLATITAEKGIKGIKEGEKLDVEITRDSCAIRFAPGQRWLYLGSDQPSGSLLLMDEYGRTMDDNIVLAKKTFGDFPADGGEVLHGTLERTCAPWDGAAFAVMLDNGVSASVYVSPGDLDKKDKNQVVSYEANGKSQSGSASIVQCPRRNDGQPENLPCQSRQGAVYIGAVTDRDVTGYIEIKDGEYHSRYVFRVTRVNKQVFCG